MDEAHAGAVRLADPAEVRTRTEFAQALTEVRARSGISIRRLGHLVDCPPTTIHGWFTGRHVPYPREAELFTRVLEALGESDSDGWSAALRRVREAPPTTTRPSVTPYLGLRSYGVADASLFFGRESLTDSITARVDDLSTSNAGSRILFVVGPSGSGKTSLLHAALQPKLTGRGLTVVGVRPGSTPLAVLDAVLTGSLDVVLIDQFEELFTLCDDADERGRFIERLVSACGADGAGLTAVVGLRADFFGEVASSGGLAPCLQDNQVIVGPFSRTELTDCIVEPARSVGLSIDDDLLAQLRRDFVPSPLDGAVHASGALPLLSHALLQTVNACSGNSMTLADYRAIGGLDGAVERAAEAAHGALDGDARAAWRRLVPRLVSIDPGGAVARRPVKFDDLDESADDVVLAMVDARILTATRDSIELTHEALLTSWPRLKSWVEEDRALLAHRGEISRAAEVWIDSDRDSSTLATGTRLSRLRVWDGDDHAHLLDGDETAFLIASIRHEADLATKERTHTRRLRALLAVATVLAVVAGVLAVVARQSASDAKQARDEALSRQLALRAGILRPTDPSLAAQLSLTAYDVAHTPEARSAVVESTVAPRSTRMLGGPGATALAASKDGTRIAVSNAVDGTIQLATINGTTIERASKLTDLAADVDVYTLAFNDAGDRLAAGGTDQTVTLWDVADLTHPTKIGATDALGGSVFALAFTADGHDLYVAAADTTLRLDLSDPALPATTDLQIGAPRGLALSPDQTTLAVASDDGAVRITSIPSADTTQLAEPGAQRATSVAFDSSGTTLAVGFKDRRVRLWDITNQHAPKELVPPESTFTSWVNSVTFSMDGQRFAAGDSDRTIRVWGTSNWSTVAQLQMPEAVTNVAFLPDRRLLTTATDGSVRLWDLNSQRNDGLSSPIWTTAYDARGHRFAAFGDTAGVWDTKDPLHPSALTTDIRPSGDFSYSGAGTIDPTGTMLAIGAGDGHVELVDITHPESPRLLSTIADATGLIESVSIFGNHTLAVGGDDGLIRLYDIADPLHPVVHSNPIDVTKTVVFAFAVSADAKILAITGSDQKAHLIDIADLDHPKQLSVIEGFGADTAGVAISPDGKFLAVGANDQSVGIWNIGDPTKPTREGSPIKGPHSSIFSLAYSPDGNELAASVTDHSVWVWDVSHPAEPALIGDLESPGGPVHATTFDPTGTFLVGAGADTDLSFWTIDPDAARTQLCSAAGDVITPDEWHTYVPTRAYEPTCR